MDSKDLIEPYNSNFLNLLVMNMYLEQLEGKLVYMALKSNCKVYFFCTDAKFYPIMEDY